MHEVTDPNRKLVWNLDRETLDQAWLAYKKEDSQAKFGEWFLTRYYIPGIIAWPSLLNEVEDEKALDMLRCFTILED